MAPSIQMFAFNTTIAKELKERIQDLIDGKRMRHDPSPHQQTIFDYTRQSRGSAIIKAVAGSGKTTTAIQQLLHIPGVDLTKVRASTFHSVGMGAIMKRLNLPYAQLQVDGSKSRTILRHLFPEPEAKIYGDYVAKLVSFAKGVGVGVLTDNDGIWYNLVRHHDLYLDSDDEKVTDERAIEIAQDVLQRSNRMAQSGMIDFDDQLYLPLLWDLKLWQNDYVTVDEAQDTNPVRREMARRALRPNGRMFAYGDPKQGIYGFTGATHTAMDEIQQQFRAIELPLTVCYRCARSIVELAQEDVPYIEAAPGAQEGTVETMALPQALKCLDANDAVLCRTTAPLIGLAMYLIAHGTACQVLGREIGTGLVNLIRRMKAKNFDDLTERLAEYRAREIAKFTAHGEEGKAGQVDDRVQCLTVIMEAMPEDDRTIDGIVERIQSLFTDTNGRVLTLATVHKAKGKEWPTVVVLRPDLMPSKWARQDWQVEQEYNVRYVCRTRAMRHYIQAIGEMKDYPNAA